MRTKVGVILFCVILVVGALVSYNLNWLVRQDIAPKDRTRRRWPEQVVDGQAAILDLYKQEAFADKLGKFEQLMRSRSRMAAWGDPDSNDPYFAWISAVFPMVASSGRLYELRDNEIVARIPLAIGDSQYDYSVAFLDASGEFVGGPTPVWMLSGAMYDPSKTSGDTIVTLSGVREGDVVSVWLSAYAPSKNQLHGGEASGFQGGHTVFRIATLVVLEMAGE